MNSILSISSIDGRYRVITNILENYFSEYSFFKYRVKVEIDYFKKLCKILDINNINEELLDKIKNEFNKLECLKIKQIESEINHDVKAVETYIGDKFTENNHLHQNLIHFGLTSQDINNVSISLSIKDYINDIFYINIAKIINLIEIKVNLWKDDIIITRTHGQPAVPSSMGKEMKSIYV